VQRKVVTVVFCDVVGSTSLGESVDPEALQALLARYFEQMKAIVEKHGGTVEKFIGDAVMAVFGVPVVREDDALRAVRVAEEMQAALGELELEGRIGVNTGEVVTGTPERLVAGDAVNVAARLQQAASPGQILLGAETHVLVADAVHVEPVEPLTLKGKSEPVAAWRLLDVIAGAHGYARRLDAPFVGRQAELVALEHELDRAVAERTCRLCTVVGEPGIGKSRLVGELLASASGRARVVVGRCLSYGEGITYWPLAEIVREVAGTEPKTRLQELLAGDEEAGLVAERIAAAVGAASAGTAAPEETYWAFRRLFEALAGDRPLIVVIEDVHWAEPTLLDLLEYVAGFSASAPILLLCIARPDLLELRPSWAAPRPNAILVSLQPLPEEASRELVQRLTGQDAERVIQAAEGNPLFVEQLVAMRTEDDGEVAVPPTLQALLAARIDRLEPDERAAVERAAVEGRSFHRGAVAELLPPPGKPTLAAALVALVRKDFIRPDRAEFPGDDGFRFGHLLIRDAAYDSVPKSLRADLHERYADWLEGKAGERLAEFEEILGYHLEQSCRYREELGSADGALAARAGAHLAAAGRRAFARGDMPAATNLLERAAALPEREGGYLLLGDLGTALAEGGELEHATQVLAKAIEQARAAGDQGAEWTSRVVRLWVIENMDANFPIDEVEREAQAAIDALQGLGDDRALAKAWRTLGDAYNARCQGALWQGAIEQAVVHARRTSDVVELCADLWLLGGVLFFGPAEVEAAGGRLEALSVEFEGNPVAEAGLSRGLAAVRGQQGRFDEARALVARAKATMAERGLRQAGSGIGFISGSVELLAGDIEAAEGELRESLESLSGLGLESRGATLALMLGRVLAMQERHDEAEDVMGPWADSHSWEDWSFVYPALRATMLAKRGELEEAERLAREAVNWSQRTDFLNWRGDVLLDLAEVLRAAAKPDEAGAAVEQALAVYEQKGNVVSANAARRLLGGGLGCPPD
jgi:class 3 adenylate cyclase/tetratricopeptide (TPR) repeat protein